MNTTLRENIDWVGAVDWNVRDFHSYDTERGTTYNAYLVRDEKTALIDTVKAPFAPELLERVAALVDLNRVDYVVCNHAELDHAGALPEVLRAMPQATLVCDKKCAAALADHFDTSAWKLQVVAGGVQIPLGRRTLRFVETPMVHWPESMATYVPEERLLFSMDAFGQHYAAAERFDDEVDAAALREQAKIYYANIVMPYGKAVQTVLDAARGSTHRHDRAQPRGDLAARPGGDRRRVPTLGRPRARAEGAGDLRHDVGEHGGHGRGHFGRGLPAGRHGVVDSRSPDQSDANCRGSARSGGRGGRLGHVEPHDDADGRRGPVLPGRTAAPGQGGPRVWLLRLGTRGPEAIDAALRQLEWEVLGEPLRARYRPTPEVLAECREAGRRLGQRAVGRVPANP